jgi:hypothetical protein
VADLTKESPDSVLTKANPGGSSATTLGQQMETLQKLQAIFVYDAKSATADGPRHFVPNFDAACGPSGTTDVGAAGPPARRSRPPRLGRRQGPRHRHRVGQSEHIARSATPPSPGPAKPRFTDERPRRWRPNSAAGRPRWHG